MTAEGKRIVDERQAVYELEKELGRGGQGAVFSVKGGKRAVKILFERSSVSREHLRRQLRQVRLLEPDLQGLPIARPLEMLNPPHLGYVMELVTGMVPLYNLMNIPRNVNSLVEWYLSGGGLRRRLLLLARCSEVLSQLHGKGLVYTDPSPHNIFVSVNTNAHEIRLIDADNLHYQSSSALKSFYTPGFGAPELVRGKSGVNTLTDAHAFAVIAFQTLCLVHPLMGDMVVEGEPELEVQALEGSMPWIDDPEDRRNSTSHGLPREIVLSPRLKKLCQRCFGEGLREPTKRPGIGQWTEDLYSATDYTLHCPECQSTYYANQIACPWCDHPRPTFVRVLIQRWEPQTGCYKEQSLILALTLQSGKPLILTSRIVTGRTGSDSLTPNIEVIFDPPDIKVRSLNGQCFWLTSVGTQRVETEVREQWRRFPAASGKFGSWLLHFLPLDRPHRIATFNFVQGGS